MEEQKTLIALRDLRPNPNQPPERTQADMIETESLAQSILREGLHYPIVVRFIPGTEITYQVADGWQRRTAFQWLVDHGHREYDRIPATLRNYSDEQMADIILTTSEKQKPLSPIGRAWLYRKYLADHPGITQAQYAERRGVSQAEIANTIRLLDLPEKVQQMIISREIRESHGRALLRLKDDARTQFHFALSVKLEEWSVATLEQKITQRLEAIAPKMTGGTATEDREITSPPKEEKPLYPYNPSEENRKCRVCGCTDDHACLVEGGEGEDIVTTCHWVEKDLCSKCAGEMNAKPQRSPETEKAAEFKEEKPPVSPSPSASPARGEETGKGTPPKQETTRPAQTPAPRPAQPARNWGRKLVVTEEKDSVRMSCMKAGGMPVFKTVPGGLLENMTVVNEWLTELEAQWAEAEKGGK